MTEVQPRAFRGRTPWGWVRQTPLRRYLRTESSSAIALLAATLVALIWANVHPGSYHGVWSTNLSLQVGEATLGQDLTGWVNNGLMTFFFFVVGLECRREFDIGELRERRRVTMPVLAGIGGMAVAVSVYLLVNAGGSTAHGWGIAMSTDTAFMLGLLALVGPRMAERLRGFALTMVVVDDILALVVITIAYSHGVRLPAVAVALAVYAVVLLAARLRVRYGLVYFVLGTAAWAALFASGVEPIVIGLAMGLLSYAYPVQRADLERASDLFRLFREQPTSELARTARIGVNAAVPPNERLQDLFHPWTSYVIVPLFALANAGITINAEVLAAAPKSPIVIGVVLAYVLGKPVGIVGMCWLVSVLSRWRLRPPVGWAAVAGTGTSAGIGFTVSLLIAALAFQGRQREEAILGVLLAGVLAAALTWAVFRLTALLPGRRRLRAVLGTDEPLPDLADPPDPQRDHVRGPQGAPVTLVEYGDFQCPYCGQAEPAVRALLAGSGDVRYIWRHLPLTDVHPRAQLAAEAAEAAGAQGQFWPMHDLLLQHQDALGPKDLLGYAAELGLDVDKFAGQLRRHVHASRVAEDVEGAAASGVVGTPTFFVNGRRHHGAYDLQTLSEAVQRARKRVFVTGGS